MIINISKEYTMTPGGRYKANSSKSGEEFRDAVLIPKLKEAIGKNENITVNLDGTYGYPTSFLDEAFGKLVKYFSNAEINLIEFISEDEPSLIDDISRYMEKNR